MFTYTYIHTRIHAGLHNPLSRPLSLTILLKIPCPRVLTCHFYSMTFMARHAESYLNYPHFVTDQIVVISASAASSIEYQ